MAGRHGTRTETVRISAGVAGPPAGAGRASSRGSEADEEGPCQTGQETDPQGRGKEDPREDRSEETHCLFGDYEQKILKTKIKIIMSLQYMNQEGLDKLKKELAEAISQRPVISAQIAEARDKGDLSENAEYEAAREAQGLLELQIAKLQNLVANARVIDESQIGTDKVQMLNKVKVKNLNTNQIMNFTLVSENEADFMAGKLAAKTPIGQALMGHSVGDVVDAKVPAGVIKFEILDITL